MTQLELQSELMSFADRFSMIIAQALEDFYARSQTKKTNIEASFDTIYTSAAIFTIAAEPNPEISLLDIVVLTTIGRMIWEEHWVNKLGDQANEMADGFRELEEDAWSIANMVLTKEEQNELRGLIRDWRKAHPDQLIFSYLRFRDFDKERRKSTLSRAEKPGGLLKSVKEATIAADEIRLLSERAMFLGTRLPLLGGAFANLWVTQILRNPEVERVLENMDRVSASTQAMTKEIQALPDRFAHERNVTIDQTMERVKKLRENLVVDVMERVTNERKEAIDDFMDRLAQERKDMIQDLVSEEKESVRGLLTDLRQTMKVGNELVSLINTTVRSTEPIVNRIYAEPADTDTDETDYAVVAVRMKEAIQELNTTLQSTEKLLESKAWKETLPLLVKVADRTESEGEELLNHAFYVGAGLILIFFLALTLTLLGYLYASRRVLR
jgi:hypothetical protein